MEPEKQHQPYLPANEPGNNTVISNTKNFEPEIPNSWPWPSETAALTPGGEKSEDGK